MKRKIEFNYPGNEVVIKIQPKFDIQDIKKVSVQISADIGYLDYEWDMKSMSFGSLKENNYD